MRRAAAVPPAASPGARRTPRPQTAPLRSLTSSIWSLRRSAHCASTRSSICRSSCSSFDDARAAAASSAASCARRALYPASRAAASSARVAACASASAAARRRCRLAPRSAVRRRARLRQLGAHVGCGALRVGGALGGGRRVGAPRRDVLHVEPRLVAAAARREDARRDRVDAFCEQRLDRRRLLGERAQQLHRQHAALLARAARRLLTSAASSGDAKPALSFDESAGSRDACTDVGRAGRGAIASRRASLCHASTALRWTASARTSWPACARAGPAASAAGRPGF